jgi:hypothetical protein
LIIFIATAFVFPHGIYTASPGVNLTFTCQSLPYNAVSVEWQVNNVPLQNMTLENVEATFEKEYGVGFLRFIEIPARYNLSVISCVLQLDSGRTIPSDDAATMFLFYSKFNFSAAACMYSVQVYVLHVDHLSAVTSTSTTLLDNIIYINWTPPISDQPITYCVDVTNTSLPSSLHSECDITRTEYNYTLPPRSWCTEYFISIVPVNEVGNGTIRTIRNRLVHNRK